MPTKAFLHKKSLLDQFKDDYKSTGYIQSARAEHTWSNPITRRKRTNKLNGWIKSFQGKRHVHKLARFNAMQNENLEEAMSLKGFLSNISDKLVNKYGLDKNKVQNYLGSHTQEMQELLDDKELSLKEKVLFVRSEIMGEKDEAKQSESLVLPNPTIIYRGTSEDAKKASHYIGKILADKGLGWGRVGWRGPKNGEFHYGHPEKDVYTVCLRGSNDLIKDSFAVYKDVFGNDFWNNCDADPQGWVDPLTINRYDVATPRQESKKSEFYMDGDDSEDYYYCHRCGRVTPSYELDAHGGFCSDCDARWTAEHENESKDTDEKLGYEKGHKNSRGEDAPWVIRSHEDNRILASFAKKKDAEEHLKRMKQYSKQEAYVDNSATAQKDYVERVISAVQDYYGYSLFNAKNLVQSNYKKVLSWFESGNVDAVEAARCLGGKCEPTKKSEAAEPEEIKNTRTKMDAAIGTPVDKLYPGDDGWQLIETTGFDNADKDAHGVTKSYKKVVDGTTYILSVSYWLTDYLVGWYRLFPIPNESKMKKTEKKSEADGDTDVFTIDLFRIYDDGEEDRIDDMQASRMIYDEDEAIKVANELADSYADDVGVVFAVVMAGERQKPNGDIVGEPFDIYWASSGNPEKTAKYRKKAGYAAFDNAMDYYAKKTESKEVTEDEGKEALRKLSKRGELPYGNNMRVDGLSLSRIADEIRYDVATALDMAAEACEDAMLDYGYDRIYVAIADGKTPAEVAADIKGSKKTESSDDDLRSRMKKIGYDLLENGNLHSWEYDFIKECLDFSEFKKLEQYLIRKGWYNSPTESKKSEGIHLELEDTIQVPEWLWKAYMLDDTTDLEEDEIEKLNDFREKYKDYHLDDKSEDPYFSSRNDFDELGGNVYDVDAYKMSNKPTEKKSESKNEALKDFPDGTNYKFTFGFYSPKTANIAKDAAEKNGYVAISDKDNNVSIWTKDPQDAIRFADTTVNLANEDERTKLERSDVDKAFAIAIKNKDYSENKETIDNATAEYAVVVHPFESFDGFSVMGELTDVVDFLEAVE